MPLRIATHGGAIRQLVSPPSPSGGITLVAHRVMAGVHPDACSRFLNLLVVGGPPGGPIACEPSAICDGGLLMAPKGASSSMRLEEDPEEGSSEIGGGAKERDGAWKVTLDQVMPPIEKREMVREAPL